MLRGGGWLPPCPGRFTPEIDPVSIIQKAGWAPGPVWTCAENLVPTGIWSPYRPARSETLPDHPYVARMTEYPSKYAGHFQPWRKQHVYQTAPLSQRTRATWTLPSSHQFLLSIALLFFDRITNFGWYFRRVSSFKPRRPFVQALVQPSQLQHVTKLSGHSKSGLRCGKFQ